MDRSDKGKAIIASITIITDIQSLMLCMDLWQRCTKYTAAQQLNEQCIANEIHIYDREPSYVVVASVLS